LPKHILGRPIGSDGKQTLARIIHCARICFGQKGYAATTFTEVGRQAGLSHAALYKYFSSKAEMYAATFNDASTALTERFDLAIAEHGDFKSRISAILRECANIAEADPDVAAFLFTALVEQARNPEIRQENIHFNLDVPERIMAIIEQGKASGEIGVEGSSEDIFLAFMASGMGIVQIQQFGGIGSTSGAIELLVDIIEARFFKQE
jgi:AcrR family transcriptional regulator